LATANSASLGVASGRIALGEHTLAEGDTICLDGESSLIYAGSLRIEHERPSALLAEVERWKAASDKAGSFSHSGMIDSSRATRRGRH